MPEPNSNHDDRTSGRPDPILVPLRWHNSARTMIRVHRLVMLVGPPGSGKTRFVRAESRWRTGAEPEVLQGTPDTELGHLWGFFALEGQNTRFCPGPLTRALESGRHFVVEEFNLVPLEVRASLLSLRGMDHVTNPFTNERLPIPGEFRLVATSNPENLACRRSGGIAQALLDDFLILEVPALAGPQVEELLEREFPACSPARRERVVGFWREYRELADHERSEAAPQLGYRSARHLLTLLEAGMEESEAIQVALVHKFVMDPDMHEAAKLKASFDA